MNKSTTIEDFKRDISTYIDFYLENNDELTEKNKEHFEKIKNDNEILTKLAIELYNNSDLNGIIDIDKFNYEKNCYINKLLDRRD